MLGKLSYIKDSLLYASNTIQPLVLLLNFWLQMLIVLHEMLFLRPSETDWCGRPSPPYTVHSLG